MHSSRTAKENKINNTNSLSLSSLDDDKDESATRCLIATFDFFLIIDVSEFGDDGVKCLELFNCSC